MDPVFDCGARCGDKIVDLRIADCHVGGGGVDQRPNSVA